MNRLLRSVKVVLSAHVVSAVLGCAAVGWSGTADASPIHLVGAELYFADLITGADALSGYQHSTNTGTCCHSLLGIDPQGPTGVDNSAISFLLSEGDNVFDWVAGNNYPTPVVGLSLFFNSTGMSFNPPDSGPRIAGDLTAVVPAGSDAFFIPLFGTVIQAYNSTPGFSDPTAYANGLASFSVDGSTVSITAFNALPVSGANPSGSFTLQVEPPAVVPEPGSLGLLGLGLAGGFFQRRRRR